ncbi:hypothetical protein, partial [Acinetobacter baumannii]
IIGLNKPYRLGLCNKAGVTLGVVVCGLFVTRKRKATRSVAINQSNL